MNIYCVALSMEDRSGDAIAAKCSGAVAQSSDVIANCGGAMAHSSDVIDKCSGAMAQSSDVIAKCGGAMAQSSGVIANCGRVVTQRSDVIVIRSWGTWWSGEHRSLKEDCIEVIIHLCGHLPIRRTYYLTMIHL